MLKSTLSKWLKFVILGMVLCGTLIYFWGFPTIGHIIIRNYPEFSFCYFPWLIFLWTTAVPCYFVLFLMWRIARSIAQNKAFSHKNAIRFKRIAQLAVGDSTFFLIGNILFLVFNMNHPSVVLCSFGIVFMGVTISVICSALSYLTSKAASLQEQSDLTI